MSPYKICAETRKRRYPSSHVARRAMATAGNRVRVYRCKACRGYHVTHEAIRRAA